MKLTISQPEPAMTQQTSQGTESQSRIAAVAQLGQQIWLDTLSRQLIESGTLARWIHEDAVAGLTSNPAIFHQALSKDAAYQPAIAAARSTESNPEIRRPARHPGRLRSFSAALDQNQGCARLRQF